MINKNIGVFIAIIIVTIFTIGCSDTKQYLYIKQNNKSINLGLKDIKKVEIYNQSDEIQEVNYHPILIKDEKLINTIIEHMDEVPDFEDKEMSGTAIKNQKIDFYDSKGDKKTVNYSYDDLYNFGNIKYNNKKFNVSYDFFRLIESIEEFRPKSSNIPDDVSMLFEKYNLTPSFLISNENKKIPNNLKYSSEETVEKIYWAYNMELSKDIGLDFSNLISKNVTAEIYSLIEPLPNSFEPLLNARGIIIRYDGKIVGAYIDSGRHDGKAISLNKRSFKDIKKEDLDVWVANNCIDKNNYTYKKISKMSNEDLIKTYITSMEEKNTSLLLSTMDVESQISTLFINLDNRKLFNEDRFNMELPGYIDSSTIAYIEQLRLEKEDKNENSKRSYNVIFGKSKLNENDRETGFSDINIDIVNEGGVWKVSSFTK